MRKHFGWFPRRQHFTSSDIKGVDLSAVVANGNPVVGASERSHSASGGELQLPQVLEDLHTQIDEAEVQVGGCHDGDGLRGGQCRHGNKLRVAGRGELVQAVASLRVPDLPEGREGRGEDSKRNCVQEGVWHPAHRFMPFA